VHPGEVGKGALARGERRAGRTDPLKGDREGQHSIRINDQWRLCFEWREGDSHEVEIVDYH